MATQSRLLAALGEKDSALKQQYRDVLPPSNLDFYIPKVIMNDNLARSSLIDAEAMSRLPSILNSVVKNGIGNGNEGTALPLRTTGDGNCLPSSLSRCMWGSEEWSSMLRMSLVQELVEREPHYRKVVAKGMEAEVDDVAWEKDFLAPARTAKAFLGPLHIFALANVLKRPIILYAHDEDAARFGFGVHGVGGLFLPHFIEPAEQVSKIPLPIAWSSDAMIHFVPLVGVEGLPRPKWPTPPSAFSFEIESSATSTSTSNRLDTAETDADVGMTDGNGIYGSDITNPFVDDLARLYTECESVDAVMASYLQEINVQHEFEAVLRHTAKLEIKRLKEEKAKREGWAIEEYKYVVGEGEDARIYDLKLQLTLHTGGLENTPVNSVIIGFNYEDDPDTIEASVFERTGVSSTNIGVLAARIEENQMQFDRDDYPARYTLYKVKPDTGITGIAGMDPSTEDEDVDMDMDMDVEEETYVQFEGETYEFVFEFYDGVLLILHRSKDSFADTAKAFLTRYNIDLKFTSIMTEVVSGAVRDDLVRKAEVAKMKMMLRESRLQNKKLKQSMMEVEKKLKEDTERLKALAQAKAKAEAEAQARARARAEAAPSEPRVYRLFPRINPLTAYLKLGKPANEWIAIIKKQIVKANVALIEARQEPKLNASSLNSLDSLLGLIAATDKYNISIIPDADLKWLLDTLVAWPIDPFFDLLRGLLNLDHACECLGEYMYPDGGDGRIDLLNFICTQIGKKMDAMDTATEDEKGVITSSMRSIRLLLRVLCNLSIRGEVWEVMQRRVDCPMNVMAKLVYKGKWEERIKSKDFCSLISTLTFNISSWIARWHITLGDSDMDPEQMTKVQNDIARMLIGIAQRMLIYEPEPESSFSTIRCLASIGTVICCAPAVITEKVVNITSLSMLRLPSVLEKCDTDVRHVAEDINEELHLLGYGSTQT